MVGLDRTADGTDAQPRPPSQPNTFSVRGPIQRSDLGGLGDRLRRWLWASHAGPVVCDVTRLHADAEVVDAMARLQLIGWHEGAEVHFRGASAELRELLGFVGLDDVLELCT